MKFLSQPLMTQNPDYMSEKRLLAAILTELQEINEKLRARESAGDEIEADEALKSFIKRYKHK